MHVNLFELGLVVVCQTLATVVVAAIWKQGYSERKKFFWTFVLISATPAALAFLGH